MRSARRSHRPSLRRPRPLRPRSSPRTSPTRPRPSSKRSRLLRVDYPDLQVIVAYNTPRPLLVEQALLAIAERDSRFIALRVEGSTSKAQNVNAALRHARGEFVGLFDADHHPQADSFTRAWRWLSNGYDVVQGHCVIRNGDVSLVARTVAVEFEAIYAVSHPGRAQLHGFGIFGGSNGFWRTEALRRTRMRGFMLTEDIDSSLRVVKAGGRIANDPALISRGSLPPPGPGCGTNACGGRRGGSRFPASTLARRGCLVLSRCGRRSA